MEPEPDPVVNAIFSKMADLNTRIDRSLFNTYVCEHRGAPLTDTEWQALAPGHMKALSRFYKKTPSGYSVHEFEPWRLEQCGIPGPYDGKWRRAEREGPDNPRPKES